MNSLSLNKRARDAFIRPWALPEGLPGRLAGWEMSVGRGQFDAEVLDHLGVLPGDHVVEIGCGPGVTAARLVAMEPSAWLTAVDPSEVMLAQAAGRNRATLDAGRVRLVRAAAEDLPLPDAQFDRAYSVNSIGHWVSAAAGLAELRRVLRSGGRFVLGSRRGLAAERLQDLERLLAAAGFRVDAVESVDTGKGPGGVISAVAS